jgi:hypothetical protein
MDRVYLPSIAMLIDRLGIVTLKSIKISSGKEDYEEESRKIMHDLDLLMAPGMGRLIRAVQINAVINEMIWANESKARKGEEQDLVLLKLTHSMNRVRNEAMGNISKFYNEAQDLKSDYMESEFTKQFGLDFGGLFE